MSVQANQCKTQYLPQRPFYHPKAKNTFSFGKSKLSRTLLDKDKKNLPGPGQYNSAKYLIKKKNPRCVIGSAKRVLGNKIINTPGVGTYDVEKILKKQKKKAGFSIGRNRRFKSLGVRVIRKMNQLLDPRVIMLILERYFFKFEIL